MRPRAPLDNAFLEHLLWQLMITSPCHKTMATLIEPILDPRSNLTWMQLTPVLRAIFHYEGVIHHDGQHV